MATRRASLMQSKCRQLWAAFQWCGASEKYALTFDLTQGFDAIIGSVALHSLPPQDLVGHAASAARSISNPRAIGGQDVPRGIIEIGHAGRGGRPARSTALDTEAVVGVGMHHNSQVLVRLRRLPEKQPNGDVKLAVAIRPVRLRGIHWAAGGWLPRLWAAYGARVV